MDIVNQMLARYERSTAEQTTNALREVMQEIALAGLQRGGFFEKAAFYGGTCLRIFHDLPRYSEDLDFSLLAPEKNFRLDHYFDHLRQEFASLGFEIEGLGLGWIVLPPTSTSLHLAGLMRLQGVK